MTEPTPEELQAVEFVLRKMGWLNDPFPRRWWKSDSDDHDFELGIPEHRLSLLGHVFVWASQQWPEISDDKNYGANLFPCPMGWCFRFWQDVANGATVTIAQGVQACPTIAACLAIKERMESNV